MTYEEIFAQINAELDRMAENHKRRDAEMAALEEAIRQKRAKELRLMWDAIEFHINKPELRNPVTNPATPGFDSTY